MEIPMESKDESPRLFYLIVDLIVLGFIASLTFPLDAQVHKLTAAGQFNSEEFIPAHSPKPAKSANPFNRTSSRTTA
jgi:hypothetical protein